MFMTCREATELLGEYVDGQLPPARRAELELHLASCADCSNYLHTYRQTIDLARRGMRYEASAAGSDPQVSDAFVESILRRRRTEPLN